jgi:tetratricopeptide (TPR) repeat protein
MPLFSSDLGHAYVLARRVTDAVPVLEEAAAVAFNLQALRIARLGQAHLLAGRFDLADQLVRDALALARVHQTTGMEARVLLLLGEVAAHPEVGGTQVAEGHYREAMTLADELGMRPLVAHCHLGLGKLYRRTSKPEQAREHLTTATLMYGEMDMRFWLEQTEAELRALG